MKALQFSGGLDSLATLFVKRPEWNNITVMWCNTGSAYLGTLSLVHEVARMVPHFKEVRSDKAAWEHQYGTGVDLVPERYTPLGRTVHATNGQTYVGFLACCAANRWHPVDMAAREMRATHIIRGQTAEQSKKAPIKSGYADPSGVVYEFPIEDWTREQVKAYVQETCPELYPEYYDRGETSSHDCWDCIAYLDDNAQRIVNLHGPEKRIVVERLKQYKEALLTDLGALENVYARAS